MRRTRPGRRRRRTMRSANLGPILKIGGLVLLGAGVITGLVFLIIALAGGGEAGPSKEPSMSPTLEPTPIVSGDLSAGTEEITLEQRNINDPYIYGREIIYSTYESGSSPDTIYVYNMDTEDATKISAIKKKNDYLFEPKINTDYIVYLDCKEDNGGTIYGYNRNSSESFKIRDYVSGMPKLSLTGKYLLWTQPVVGADKIYLFDLETQGVSTIEDFSNSPYAVSGSYMSNDAIIYTQAEGESQLLNGSSAVENTQICIIPLVENGDMKQRVFFNPGMYAYDPMISGDYIVFLDSNRDSDTHLMMSKREDGSFSTPKDIASGVMNYRLGDGYVAYTKDEAIYVYYFEDGSTARLSAAASRALLASVYEKDIIWYDVTDFGDVADVLIHIIVP